MYHRGKVHRKILSMNLSVRCALISFSLCCFSQWSNAVNEERAVGFLAKNGFLAYRTVSNYQKFCNCETAYTGSCCQSVTILYTKAQKNLCVNFTYQPDELNIKVILGSNTLTTRTVTDYKPVKFCISIPGCLFSSACVNIVELNKFPRSITACLRLDVFSKKRLWQLNYTCVSISTELPMMASNATNTTTMSSGMVSSSSQASTATTTTTASTATTTTASATTTTTTAMTKTTATTTITTTTTTTMTPTKAETEETTKDVEVITLPGLTEIVDID